MHLSSAHRWVSEPQSNDERRGAGELRRVLSATARSACRAHGRMSPAQACFQGPGLPGGLLPPNRTRPPSCCRPRRRRHPTELTNRSMQRRPAWRMCLSTAGARHMKCGHWSARAGRRAGSTEMQSQLKSVATHSCLLCKTQRWRWAPHNHKLLLTSVRVLPLPAVKQPARQLRAASKQHCLARRGAGHSWQEAAASRCGRACNSRHHCCRGREQALAERLRRRTRQRWRGRSRSGRRWRRWQGTQQAGDAAAAGAGDCRRR